MLNYLPPFIESKQEEFGAVLELTIPAPGIYRLITSIHEAFYVVRLDYDGDVISRDIFQYGEILDDVVLFSILRGQYILEYELTRYRRKTAYDQVEINYLDALMLNFSEAERPFAPQYFGHYLPPAVSPAGVVMRYQAMSNGAFLVDSGGRWFVALHRAMACLDSAPFVSHLELMTTKSDYYFIYKNKFSSIAAQLYQLFPGLERFFPREK